MLRLRRLRKNNRIKQYDAGSDLFKHLIIVLYIQRIRQPQTLRHSNPRGVGDLFRGLRCCQQRRTTLQPDMLNPSTRADLACTQFKIFCPAWNTIVATIAHEGPPDFGPAGM